MATIDVYANNNFNMIDASVWYGTVEVANASQIIISNGVDETIYSGRFTYDSSGVHGTLTGITELVYGYTAGPRLV